MELDDVIDAELQLRLEDTDPEDEGDSGDDAAEEEDGPVKWEGWGIHNVDQRVLPGSATWEPMFNLPSGFPGLIHANEIQFMDLCFPRTYVVPSVSL